VKSKGLRIRNLKKDYVNTFANYIVQNLRAMIKAMLLIVRVRDPRRIKALKAVLTNCL
jgi:hypothetical protein